MCFLANTHHGKTNIPYGDLSVRYCSNPPAEIAGTILIRPCPSGAP